jgi:hypothetical protein
VTFGEIERGSVDDDDDDYASTIFGRFPGCYALLVKSALAGNMGFAVALGKAILVHMYVLKGAVQEWSADVRRRGGVVIGG